MREGGAGRSRTHADPAPPASERQFRRGNRIRPVVPLLNDLGQGAPIQMSRLDRADFVAAVLQAADVAPG